MRRRISARGTRSHFEAEGHVFENRHVREKPVGLENRGSWPALRGEVSDTLPTQIDLPFGGDLKTAHHAERRGLSTA
jgi:hypothetical protein